MQIPRIMQLTAVVWLAASATMVWASDPPWNQIEAAAQARDFARLEAWVKDRGLGSHASANVLIAAAGTGDKAFVDRILGLGISSNTTNVNGVTALLNVARHGQTAMVRHLLERGANANTITFCEESDCKGHTPLLWAACRQDVGMARMLLEAGADPRAAGNAAAQKANDSGDVQMTLLLKQFGAPAKSKEPPPVVASPGAPAFAMLGLTQLLPGNTGVRAAATPGSKARLSVIADEPNVALGDMLTAHLSAEPLLEIVERQELERILAEQRLTRQFAASALNYAQVAELLRADALLLIQARRVAGSQVVESRLIRVDPGLVLDTIYAPAPIAKPIEWSQSMSQRIKGLTAKVVRPDAIALSFLNIRAAVSTRESRGLDRTLAVLLNDRLAHQPQYLLLERAAMDQLTFETNGRFWTGSYLVDGTVEPALDGSGTFSLSIRLQPTRQGEALTFAIAGRRTDPAAAVDHLLTQMNARLGGSQVPTRRDLADEARRYHEESSWALAAEQPGVAQGAAEAAWALGLQTIEVARLRVTAAMRSVRLDPELGPADSLDLAIHGLTVWREMLQHSFAQRNANGLRNWLEFGLEAVDDGTLAIIRVPAAAEQLQQAERLDALRELIWTSLEDTFVRSEELPPETGVAQAASGKQAAVARLVFPQIPRFVGSARALLGRRFAHKNSIARARIRANLLLHWNLARVMVQTSRTTSGSATLALPPSPEASHLLAKELQNSPASEDRFVGAVLAISAAASRQEATTADVDRLRKSLLDSAKLLAEGGEVFQLYWERFEALDRMQGVPFFAMTRTFSANRDRMWERHTPEHAEFCRQLHLRVSELAKGPAADFRQLMLRAQQATEAPAQTAAQQPSPERATRPSSARDPVTAVDQRPTPPATIPPLADSRQTLAVHRLWNPFNTGVKLVPEFRADYVTMAAAEGRVWLHGCTLDVGGQPDKHYIFAIDPETMGTETLEVPERSLSLNGRILVTSSYLLFSAPEFLAVRDRAAGTWQVYKEIRAASLSPPAFVDDTLYLVVGESPGNAVVSFNLAKRSTEVLASTRRRPALSPLDDPALVINSVATNEAGEIVAVAGKTRHAWNPKTRTWTSLPPEPRHGVHAANGQGNGHGRVGVIRKVNGVVGLHFTRPDAVIKSVPLEFVFPEQLVLPQSRYGPQNIRPDYCNSFPGGLLLVPSTGSGFWIVTGTEMDHFQQVLATANKPLTSAGPGRAPRN